MSFVAVGHIDRPPDRQFILYPKVKESQYPFSKKLNFFLARLSLSEALPGMLTNERQPLRRPSLDSALCAKKPEQRAKGTAPSGAVPASRYEIVFLPRPENPRAVQPRPAVFTPKTYFSPRSPARVGFFRPDQSRTNRNSRQIPVESRFMSLALAHRSNPPIPGPSPPNRRMALTRQSRKPRSRLYPHRFAIS